MATLLNAAIAGAVTASLSPVLQLRPGPGGRGFPNGALIQGNFTYGSGGTSADAWVQTSLDGGTTWIDVANFHFTTSSQRFVYNLSSSTAVSVQYPPTDGTLTANTSKDGIIGNLWRVKYTTIGVYATTTLRVDMISDGITAQS
jgi:hypothetical protein